MIGILYSPSSGPILSALTPGALCPVAGQYRMMDFALSNLVNAGVGTVGIMTAPEHRKAVCDYLGVGQEWDLDRRRGGIHWLGAGTEETDSLLSFLRQQRDPYVILADAAAAWTVGCRKLLYQHLETGCDITVLRPEMLSVPAMYLLSRGLLLALLEQPVKEKYGGFLNQLNTAMSSQGLSVCRLSTSGFAMSVTSPQAYYMDHMALLQSGNLSQLFSCQYPIHTRQQDWSPAFIACSAKLENSLVSEGCRVCGSVSNSVLFHSTCVGENASVDRCVLLPGCHVEAGANLQYVLSGPNRHFRQGAHLAGTFENPIILNEGDFRP